MNTRIIDIGYVVKFEFSAIEMVVYEVNPINQNNEPGFSVNCYYVNPVDGIILPKKDIPEKCVLTIKEYDTNTTKLFQVGSVVKFNSKGSSKMVINQIDNSSKKVSCYYEDKSGKINELDSIPIRCLTLCP